MSTTEKQVREVEGVKFEQLRDDFWRAAGGIVCVSCAPDGKTWSVDCLELYGLPPATATRLAKALAAAAKLATQLNDEAGQQVTQ